APLLIIIAWVKKIPILFPVGQRLFQLAISMFYFAIPFSLMIYGEVYVNPGLAAIIFANMPVAILIASFLFLNEKTNSIQITGLIIALASLSFILITEARERTESQWTGVIALSSAVIIHAIVYTQCKKRCCKVSVISFNALPCFIAGVILSLVGSIFERPQLSALSLHSTLATMYLGCFAGVFGILCYFSLQKRASAFQASLVFLIFPLIAVSLESYIYGKTISTYSILLIIPLVIGILITLIPKKTVVDKNKMNS
ncbi:TPA: DMT family inner membrane transporter PEG344, partial [Klebsiella pneumoniae]